MTGGPDDRVQFTLWDGSLRLGVMQTQIKLSLAATAAAADPSRAGLALPAARPLGTSQARWPSRLDAPARLSGNWREEMGPVMQLLDHLYTREADKRQAVALLANTYWQF
jgi:hypothetical protein